MRRDEPLSEPLTRARFELGERRVVAQSVGQAPAQEPRRPDPGAGAASPPSAARCWCCPATPPGTKPSCAPAPAELGVAADIRFAGGSARGELEGLWALADAFVFPSLYEGFGLPVLEAMARGVPVACCDASSLPEVAGDAALLFDPRSEQAIVQAIERLLGEPALASELRAKGLARAREFTWARTARLTLQSYARALGFDGVPEAWGVSG